MKTKFYLPVAGGLLLCATAVAKEPAQKNPNIIFILADEAHEVL